MILHFKLIFNDFKCNIEEKWRVDVRWLICETDVLILKKVYERTIKLYSSLSCDKSLIMNPDHQSSKSEIEQAGWNDSTIFHLLCRRASLTVVKMHWIWHSLQ